MSIRDDLRRLFRRAKNQANDLAQVARLKLDVRDLQGRRDFLFREIGSRVYRMNAEGRAPSEFEALCNEIRTVEERIAKKQGELNGVRARPQSA